MLKFLVLTLLTFMMVTVSIKVTQLRGFLTRPLTMEQSVK